MSKAYLPPGLPAPHATRLDAPYWNGLREARLLLQRCRICRCFQWGPEWICHRCLSWDLHYAEIEPHGVLYSCERVWHPVHPVLAGQGPYLVGLIELPHADGVRLVGNLLGDPLQSVVIGTKVEGVFEHHGDASPAYSLLQWRLLSAA